MNAFYASMPPEITGIALVLFWVSVAAIFYVYVGYPLLLAIVSLFAPKRSKDPLYTPRVSVLIAAYNEEASIERKIRETLALEYPQDKLEILVVSDGSSDRTDTIVAHCTDARVRLLRVEGRRGKTHAQNEGVKQCTGEIIVFSDATAVYHPQSIRRIVANYVDPRVGAVSGRYQYFDLEGGSPTGLGSIAFWNYENVIKLLQSRIATLTGCSGCIYSVRKDRYVPLPYDACSDLVEPLNIVRNGYRVAFEDSALAYEETTASSNQEFKMRVRVATRGMRGVLSVAELLHPWKRPWVTFQLFSHKILRWLAPVFLMTLFLSSGLLIENIWFRYFFLLQAICYGFALLSLVVPLHRRWKPLGLPLFFCTLNAAAMVSLCEVIRGHKYTTWETVRSGEAPPKTVQS